MIRRMLVVVLLVCVPLIAHADDDGTVPVPTATPVALGPWIDPDLAQPTPVANVAVPDGGAPMTAQVVTYFANVRAHPHKTGNEAIAVIAQGDTVTLVGQLTDRTWFEVTLADGRMGWMHHSVLDIDPASLGAIPFRTGILRIGDHAMLLPGSDPNAAEHPETEAAVLPQVTAVAEPNLTTNGSMVIVTEMPPVGDLAQQQAPRAEQLSTVILHACYDANGNKACDVDEGIRGLTVYVGEARTARLLAQGLTDTSGVVQLAVRAPQGATLVVTVPHFGAAQTTSADDPRLQPVIVNKQSPIPVQLP